MKKTSVFAKKDPQTCKDWNGPDALGTGKIPWGKNPNQYTIDLATFAWS